jgi:hypothetical protein
MVTSTPANMHSKFQNKKLFFTFGGVVVVVVLVDVVVVRLVAVEDDVARDDDAVEELIEVDVSLVVNICSFEVGSGKLEVVIGSDGCVTIDVDVSSATVSLALAYVVAEE